MIRWILLAAVLVVIPAALADDTKQNTEPTAAQEATKENPMDEAAQSQPAAGLHPRVTVETTLGDLVLELDGEKAPISTKNFIDYVEAGFYDGTVFHRVKSDFMVQGGGFTEEMDQKTEGLRPPIKNEWRNGLKNVRGTVAMARTAAPDSATAQFFINVVDNGFLDQARGGAAYAVFGKVLEGSMEVLDKIRDTKVITHPKYPSREGAVTPETPVVIKSAKVTGKCDSAALAKAAEAAEAEIEQARAKANAERDKVTAAKPDEYIKKVEAETGKKFEKTASGLMYMVLKEGDGPSPTPTDTVEVHYVGTFLDGKEFDSSVSRGKPATFPLNRVIKGWTEGVALMKVGEKRKLICPPDLAYGPGGRPGIPPNSTLVFDIELLSINPPAP